MSTAVSQAAILVLQLESPLAVVEFAAEIAARHGVPVALNPAPARPLPASLLANITYLVPNESKAALLADCAVADMAVAAGTAGVGTAVTINRLDIGFLFNLANVLAKFA
jgi:ribokinase